MEICFARRPSATISERYGSCPYFRKTIIRMTARLASELKHCILAHHGELEYGSPKKPALMEAVALNMADNTDAKLETMREILKAAGDRKDWLGYNRLFESNIRKSS